MKKSERYILATIALIAVCFIGWMKIREGMKTNSKSPSSPTASTSKNTGLPKPTEAPKGKWVGIVHKHEVIKWFDSGIDGKYTVEGNYGKFSVECKNGKWHAYQVECPNHLCEKMGWDDGNLLVPITCIPNDIYVGTSDWIESYVNS